MDSFTVVKSKVKTKENYIKRNYKTVGGMWNVDTWIKGDVVFKVLDEGYTEVIFIPFTLEVVKRFDNTLEFILGDKDILDKLAQVI